MLTNQTTTLSTYNQLSKAFTLKRVTHFLKSKKEKNYELIKLKTYMKTSRNITSSKKHFDSRRAAIHQSLKSSVWQILESSKEVREFEFEDFFIGLKGDIYKAYKHTENELKDNVDQLREQVFKQSIVDINNLKKRGMLKQKFSRSIKNHILEEISQLIADAKRDRLSHMLRLKKDVIQYVSECGRIEGPKSKAFERELKAEIFALTR